MPSGTVSQPSPQMVAYQIKEDVERVGGSIRQQALAMATARQRAGQVAISLPLTPKVSDIREDLAKVAILTR